MGSEEHTVWIRMLGPFEVLVAGTPVAVPDRLRCLLAALALSPGRPLSVDELAGAIWGDDLPSRVKGSVQTAVMRLRQVIGEDAIVTGSAGYRLVGAETDVDTFHRLLDRARQAGGTDAERGLLADAVALWRGAPLDGVASAALRGQRVPPLEERFLAAVERRADLDIGDIKDIVDSGDIAADGGTELCTELRGLTARYPLREPLWERLIRALAGTGRNAEALSAYARCRDLLADELGVEPNARLRRLHLDLLRATDAPPATEPAAAIPQPLTRLFGRDDEVAALVDALTAGTNRLITLTGVAGIGKTRLALAAAHAAATRGLATWWVPLSAVPRAELVLPAIAHAVAAPEVSVAGIGGRLAGRTALVVVDNLEHLDGVGEVLADLLTAVPAVRVLATGRAPAGVAGEQEWLVPALPVPADEPDETNGAANTVAEVSSVALFVDRVRAATPSFELTEDVREVVVDICRQLHGLPLGLELAAGQWRVLGAAVAASIREAPLDLRAVAGGQRHGSLRDAIAASYALLDDDTRDTLCRLAEFHGGWTYELAALAVTDDALLTRLDRLVSLGLVHVADTATGRRFAMVPVIQAFAAAQAGERDVAGASAAGHANAVRRWVDQIRDDLHGGRRAETIAALDAERANLLAAHRWFADNDPAAGLALISALRTYWRSWARDDEALACFLSFLGLAADVEQVGEVLSEAAVLDIATQHPADAAALVERALAVCRHRGDTRGQVHGLTLLGWMNRQNGLATALGHHHAAVDVAAGSGDPLLHGQALLHLAGPLADQGCYADAEELLGRAVDIATTHDHPFVLFDALLCRTEIRRRHGDVAGATASLQRARGLFDRTGQVANQTFWHVQTAVLAAHRGDLDTARTHAARALGMTRGREVRNRCVSCAWWAQGEVLLRSGDQAGAADAFRRALATDTASRSDRLVEVLLGLADTAAGAAVAVHALAAAHRLRDRDQLRLPPPVADRLRAVGDRWVAAVGEPAWRALRAAAETRCAEDVIVVLDCLAAHRRPVLLTGVS